MMISAGLKIYIHFFLRSQDEIKEMVKWSNHQEELRNGEEDRNRGFP
jgi:hypothetical protein